jgi:hypothetical protein
MPKLPELPKVGSRVSPPDSVCPKTVVLSTLALTTAAVLDAGTRNFGNSGNLGNFGNSSQAL